MHVLMMDLQCVLAASLVHALSLSDEILAEAKVEREQVGAEARPSRAGPMLYKEEEEEYNRPAGLSLLLCTHCSSLLGLESDRPAAPFFSAQYRRTAHTLLRLRPRCTCIVFT